MTDQTHIQIGDMVKVTLLDNETITGLVGHEPEAAGDCWIIHPAEMLGPAGWKINGLPFYIQNFQTIELLRHYDFKVALP